jgi:hypothetical protein
MEFISVYDEKLEALELREQELRDVIQDELDELDHQRYVVLEEREQAINEYFAASDPEDLLDPLKAGALYELGFDKGRGSRGFGDFYQTLVSDTYVSNFSGWWALRQEKAPVKMPTFILETTYDPKLLERSLKLLEALYVAAKTTNHSVPIDIYGLGVNYKIKLVDGSWTIYKNDKPIIEGIENLAKAIEKIQ